MARVEASQYVNESYSAVRSALQARGCTRRRRVTIDFSATEQHFNDEYCGSASLGAGCKRGSDGTVYFTSLYPFSYSQTATPPSNEYYFIGVLEHEITEVMGRVSLLNQGSYSPIDLYRYSASGVRDLTTGGSGSTAYFSIDNGATNLGTWNNQPSNGDLADWYPQGPASGGNDAFNDYSNSGVINAMSSADITLMEAIGWTTTSGPPPPPPPTVTSVAESPSSGIVNAGKVVVITVDLSAAVTVAGGTPMLMLNDGGTASYTSGSGTNALTFDYTVLAGQNTNDLQISSINLNGATVTGSAGTNADFSNLTSVTPAGIVQVYTTPTASVNAHSFNVYPNQGVGASSFFTIVNPNSDSITQYSFEDNGGGSGHFTLAGTVEPNGQAFTISASNLSSVQYIGGGSVGTDKLVVDAYDATAAAWMPAVSVNAVTTAPSASVSASGFTVSLHQAVAASSFFTVTNPSGDSITQYSFEDNGGGTGYFTMGGTVEPNGQAFIVTAGNLSSVQYFGGGSAGTDTLVVDAYDASAAVWLSSASISAVTTAPFPFANVADFTQALYIGYFGRAGDPGGDAYWLNQLNSGNISEAGMAASFSVQSEATALYSFLANPPVATIAQIDSFIGAVYEDLFNRAPDAGGLAYWQKQLQTNLGNPHAVGAFILNVISGAQGSDQTTIANKVTVADFFTQELNAAGISFTSSADSLSHSAIASVTSTSSTVLAAESTVNNWLTTQSSAAEVALVGMSHTSAVAEHPLA